jgi:hypothetical protein
MSIRFERVRLQPRRNDLYNIVILSEARVREANSRAVEGPLRNIDHSCRCEQFSQVLFTGAITPCHDRATAGVQGILRLRGCSASRSTHSAQDDSEMNELGTEELGVKQ